MTLDFTAPGRAESRTDLTFLRRRRPAAPPDSGGGREVPGAGSLDLDGGMPGGALPSSAGVRAPHGRVSLDLDGREPVEPARGDVSLDLDGQAPVGGMPSTAGMRAPRGRVSLDLDGREPVELARGDLSLDLGGEPAVLDRAPRPSQPDTRLALPVRRVGRPGRPVVRLGAGRRLQLGPKTPAVTLDRLQSAIGLLTAEAVSGTVTLGCAYDLADGRSGFLGSGTTASRTPVLAVRRRSVSADLRQVRQLARLVVIAVFPPAEAPPGLLVVSTWDGGRLELSLGKPGRGRVTVPLSLHNVGGELVLRAEEAEALSSPRAAAEAFGFDRISWLDDSTCAGGVA
ncbi:hypothetical protein Amsp01_016600 [Amycolatopsis sp. NBRC 101858]|uniref:hypothetical protein n=1 Tax=Amycolatopsis sp. NBRC 101858 TaxID=3032200 RepID=UPI0024A157C4|nr:hypothetical protein [Amycolatopsis sp. NBRC 101858]GLY35636.1 hypothetical protein Amsp01_016600 [Amycolatopsis sp. NBRC 101858]